MTGMIIVDLDGTLADSRLAEQECFGNGENDVRGFLNRISEFKFREHIKYIVDSYQDFGYDIFFLTARPEGYRKATIKWLSKKYNMTNGFNHLRMLTSSDPMNHVKYKVKVVEKLIEEGHNIALILDDDPDVVESFVNMGLPILHVPNTLIRKLNKEK